MLNAPQELDYLSQLKPDDLVSFVRRKVTCSDGSTIEVLIDAHLGGYGRPIYLSRDWADWLKRMQERVDYTPLDLFP